MKILLDESLPLKLKNDFKDTLHEVFTVKDKGWLGKKNGELLQLVEENNFELFVTVDRNIRFQQNLAKYNFSICVLIVKDNRYETLKKSIDNLKHLLNRAPFPKFFEVPD